VCFNTGKENGCRVNQERHPTPQHFINASSILPDNLYINLGKPKSVASDVIYLDVVNNYTVIKHVKQILHDFVVSAVSAQNCTGKCAKSQVLFLPTASQPFFRP